MEFDYSHPDTDLRFGRGRRDEVGEVAAEYGDAVHVVTTRSAMQDAGFLDGVLTSLDAADVETTVTEGVQPNPTVEDVLRVVDDARGSDAVIGFGGGSVIDAAKTAALCLGTFDTTPSREEVWEYCIGEKGVESSIPVLVVPTTSGTGSHIDPWAVISNEDERAKPGFGGDELIPEAAIVDPEVLDEMPSDLAAVTGFDAFCHLNEAYVGDSANPMADVFAREGIERVAEYLPESVSPEDDDEKREARDEMAVADTLAGICETTSMVVATHGLAHSISAYDPSVPHGEALASVASEVAAYNVENGDEETKRRYGEVAELLGMPVADRKLDAALAVDAFDELKREIGLDVSVGDLGIDEDALGWLAEHTVEYMEMSIGNNPVELEEEDLVEILDDAY